MKQWMMMGLLVRGLILPAQAQRDRFSANGVQVGGQVPDLDLFDSTGDTVKLSNVWKSGPVLIVTGSLTCPVARRKCPLLEETLRGIDGVKVVVVYTIDAHPDKDPSPYSGKVWITSANEKESIFHRQPVALEERLELMKKFIKTTGLSWPVYADGMDNHAWKVLGSGPNLAVLVDDTGTVVARQGWLDPEAMRMDIHRLLQK